MKIYPKGFVDFKENLPLSEYIEKYKGFEIQMANQSSAPSFDAYNIEEVVDFALHQFPFIDEIVVHLPLNDCYLEEIALLNPDRLLDEMLSAISAAEKHKIHVNVLYHTGLEDRVVVKVLRHTLENMLTVIKGREVSIIVENSSLYRGQEISSLVLCDEIMHPQLKACIDTTHIKCMASVYKEDAHEYMKEKLSYFDKKELNDIVKVIHFAQALSNDGYIVKKTHGRKHENTEELRKDLDILKEAGIQNAIYVTEISEDDYYTREDQLWEISELEKYMY